MKKSSIIIISAAASLILIIIFVVGTLRYRPEPVPTFKFLSGRTLTTQIEDDPSIISRTRFVYSFEADFDDFVADANSELTALDYSIISGSDPDYPNVEYYLRGKKPIIGISVNILKNIKMNVFSTPKNSDYKTSTQYVYGWQNGWVTVEIEQRKQRNRIIVELKKLLHKSPAPAE